jgi:hypothetical protein
MKKLKGWKFSFKRDAISIKVWKNQQDKREFEKTSSLFLGFARLEQLEGSRRRRRSAGEKWHFVVGL